MAQPPVLITCTGCSSLGPTGSTAGAALAPSLSLQVWTQFPFLCKHKTMSRNSSRGRALSRALCLGSFTHWFNAPRRLRGDYRGRDTVRPRDPPGSRRAASGPKASPAQVLSPHSRRTARHQSRVPICQLAAWGLPTTAQKVGSRIQAAWAHGTVNDTNKP